MEKKKERGVKSGCFWLHVLLAGGVTYALLMQWTNWIVPLSVSIAHGLIDFWKIRNERSLDSINRRKKDGNDKQPGSIDFFVDQLLHVAAIVVAWLYLTDTFSRVFPAIMDFFFDKKNVTILTAFVIVIWPAGITIEKITEPFRKELAATDSLRSAGNYIGVSERVLVLIFVLVGRYDAIGFLIAGKSILRVSKDGDGDARKKTEYVLFGTLLSFTVAIVVGLLTKYIIAAP